MAKHLFMVESLETGDGAMVEGIYDTLLGAILRAEACAALTIDPMVQIVRVTLNEPLVHGTGEMLIQLSKDGEGKVQAVFMSANSSITFQILLEEGKQNS